jgi:ankyrin repeat protein
MREAWFTAAKASDIGTVQDLMQHGIDIWAKDRTGTTAFDYALGNNNLALLKLLYDATACEKQEELRRQIVMWRRPLAVKELQAVEKMFGFSVWTDYGITLLEHAVREGNVSVMDWLIREGGLDLCTEHKKVGLYLLSKAVFDKQLNVVQYLVAVAGVEINESSDNDYSAVVRAVRLRAVEIVAWLLKQEYQPVDFNAFDRGKTFLEVAVFGGPFSKDIMRLLINNHRFDINTQQNTDKRTVLMEAACYEGYPNEGRTSLEYIKFLVNEGKALVYLKDAHGKTAADLAVDPAVKKFLRSCEKEISELEKRVSRL